eukprot:1160836-Pelagomonas_calceolata.AAC.12
MAAIYQAPVPSVGVPSVGVEFDSLRPWENERGEKSYRSTLVTGGIEDRKMAFFRWEQQLLGSLVDTSRAVAWI